VWCASGTTVAVDCAVANDAQPYEIELTLLAPDGAALSTESLSQERPGPARWEIAITGWHTVRIKGTQLPVPRVAFTATVTYAAPEQL
jgi:hypothetical protein